MEIFNLVEETSLVFSQLKYWALICTQALGLLAFFTTNKRSWRGHRALLQHADSYRYSVQFYDEEDVFKSALLGRSFSN